LFSLLDENAEKDSRTLVEQVLSGSLRAATNMPG
jgi:hypothetical protein